MISLRADLKVVLATHPVDFRKSVHTLSALVSEALRANPYCGDVFVFRSKRMDRVKLLAWDGSGMVLVTKWLHERCFTWPPIRDGVVNLSATQFARCRRAGVDAVLAEACEAAGAGRVRDADFAGASTSRMYRLVMAIRPDALPTDPTALTAMVLALDAENEKLRAAMQTLKEMIFGKRSERLAALFAEQFALDLGDLETGAMPPVPANDDTFAAKPAGRPRQKARRNIGALPKHLPRCEQVLEPDTTACPCCQGRLHKIGEDVSEVLDVIPAILRVLRTIRPKYGCRSCTDGVIQAKVLPAPDRERHGLDGAGEPRGGLEVRLVSAAVPAGADTGRSGHPSRPRDARRLGQACGLVAQKPL